MSIVLNGSTGITTPDIDSTAGFDASDLTGALPAIDGSALTGLTAGGGGGGSPDLYAENPVTPTAPSATGDNAVAIGSGAKADSADSIGIGSSAWARGANVFAAFGDARAISSVAIGLGTVASNNYSVALGRDAYALADSAVSIGKGRASGADSLAAAITNNTASYGATGLNALALGPSAKASGSRAISLGRYSQATGGSSVAIGSSAVASGSDSLALGRSVEATGSQSGAVGYSADATALRSFALGHSSLSNIIGKYAYAGGFIAALYDSQTGTFVLRKGTTDATPAALSTDSANATAGTDDQVILPNNSAFAFSGTIVARQQASTGTASAAWKIEGLIRREGTAGTTVLVNSATTVLDNTPAWGMALTADTTNGGLAITVTGAASTNIRWVATINTSEVTY